MTLTGGSSHLEERRAKLQPPPRPARRKDWILAGNEPGAAGDTGLPGWPEEAVRVRGAAGGSVWPEEEAGADDFGSQESWSPDGDLGTQEKVALSCTRQERPGYPQGQGEALAPVWTERPL